MFGSRRTHVFEQISAGSSKRHARLPDNFLRHWVRREPHRHRREPAGTQIRNAFLLGQNHGHRARPIGLRQRIRRIGNILGNVSQLRNLANVNNQRVKSRAFLNCKNLRQRRRQISITRKAVNSLGRNCHHLSIVEQARGIVNTCPRRKLHFQFRIKNSDFRFKNRKISLFA